MMVYKIILDITGKNLYPDELRLKLSNELVFMARSFKPSDTFMKRGKIEQYGFGCAYLMHPREICLADEDVEEYENTIVQFIEKNYEIIIANGGSDICVSYSVFFSHDTYTIGLFNREQLKILTNCNATISFNTYHISEEKILKMIPKLHNE